MNDKFFEGLDRMIDESSPEELTQLMESVENPCKLIQIDSVRKVTKSEIDKLLVSETVRSWHYVGCNYFSILFVCNDTPATYEVVSQ
jgi:hypothetical protein